MMHITHAASHRRPLARWAAAGCLSLVMCASAIAAHAHDPSDSDSRHEVSGPAKRPRVQVGIASVYARLLHGRKTASGEIHDGNDFTAAHRTLPLGTLVKVTNLANHRSVIVRINDRGPALKSRIIDLSPTAGAQIGLRARGKGLARVRLEVVDHEVAQASAEEKP